MTSLLIILILIISFNNNINIIDSKSIILANYYNVLLFFPKEYGGNDDLRVIFDIRNTTIKTFTYLPVIVSVAYNSELNNAYCYLESATTSYIMLLKWTGGRWCYQILFEFPASQFQKYMYHSVVLMDNFIYWSTDQYIMSGRLPTYEKRVLLQPAWNRLYSMSLDKPNRLLYVAAYDYTENALFSCTLTFFSCTKLLTTEFTINYIYFSHNDLYLTSIQSQYLYRYSTHRQELDQLNTVQDIMSNLIVLDDKFAIYTDQLSLTMVTDFNFTRKTNAHLIDPYALQYVFSVNKIFEFDTYYMMMNMNNPNYQNILYRNNLYLFYFYICGMDYVENDLEFLPQMDLNNRFLSVQNCQNRSYKENMSYFLPAIIAGCSAFVLISLIVTIFLWRYSIYRKNKSKPAPPTRSQPVNISKRTNKSELYDNDPIDLNYSKYIKNKRAKTKPKRSKPKLPSFSSFSSFHNQTSSSDQSIKSNIFKVESNNNNVIKTLNGQEEDYDFINNNNNYNTLTHVTSSSDSFASTNFTLNSNLTLNNTNNYNNFVTSCQVIPFYTLTPELDNKRNSDFNSDNNTILKL